MVVVGAAILPHGTMILDEKKPKLPNGAIQLHNGCEKVGDDVAQLNLELIVLCTPHGIALYSSIGIYLNPTAKGNAEWNDCWQEFKVEIKLDEAKSLAMLQHMRSNGSSSYEIDGINSFARYDGLHSVLMQRINDHASTSPLGGSCPNLVS